MDTIKKHLPEQISIGGAYMRIHAGQTGISFGYALVYSFLAYYLLGWNWWIALIVFLATLVLVVFVFALANMAAMNDPLADNTHQTQKRGDA